MEQSIKLTKNMSDSIHAKLEGLWQNFEQNHGYKLLEILGESGYGKVYKTEKISNGKTYVIKLIANAFEDIYSAKQVLKEV